MDRQHYDARALLRAEEKPNELVRIVRPARAQQDTLRFRPCELVFNGPEHLGCTVLHPVEFVVVVPGGPFDESGCGHSSDPNCERAGAGEREGHRRDDSPKPTEECVEADPHEERDGNHHPQEAQNLYIRRGTSEGNSERGEKNRAVCRGATEPSETDSCSDGHYWEVDERKVPHSLHAVAHDIDFIRLEPVAGVESRDIVPPEVFELFRKGDQFQPVGVEHRELLTDDAGVEPALSNVRGREHQGKDRRADEESLTLAQVVTEVREEQNDTDHEHDALAGRVGIERRGAE